MLPLHHRLRDRRDSNPNREGQSLSCYHYTTDQTPDRIRTDITRVATVRLAIWLRTYMEHSGIEPDARYLQGTITPQSLPAPYGGDRIRTDMIRLMRPALGTVPVDTAT